jgi:hypothetical protein
VKKGRLPKGRKGRTRGRYEGVDEELCRDYGDPTRGDYLLVRSHDINNAFEGGIETYDSVDRHP